MKMGAKFIFFFSIFIFLRFNAFASEQISPYITQYAFYYKQLNELKLNTDKSQDRYSQNINHFTQILKLHEEFKNFELNIGLKLIAKVESGLPLTGDELYFFNKTLHLFYTFSTKINEYSKYFNYRKFYSLNRSKSLSIDETPLKNQLMFINGQVQFLDHAIKMNNIYYKLNDDFRRIIKKSIESYDPEENKYQKNLIVLIEETIVQVSSRDFINKIVLYSKIKVDKIEQMNLPVDVLYNYYEIYKNQITKDILKGNTDFRIEFYDSKDKLTNIFNNFTNWLSSVFGNFSGSIKWRSGRLYQNEMAFKELTSKLRPMDILLEKSPFVLTDKFIPGHFGHAALYLGTKEQLVELGLWFHPSIVPYQEEILKGKTILEAVRPGVRLNTLAEFMNIDEVLISRKNDAHKNLDVMIENYTRGFDQLGKEYDFNFDIETLDKIVCSELIYIVFGEVNWPTKYRFGRATISPDDVAEINFFKETKFNIEHYIIGDENKNISKLENEYLAKDLNYVLRAENGGPIIDKNDPTNTFFKLSEQCYNFISETDSNQLMKECKTTYTLKYYAENSVEEKL